VLSHHEWMNGWWSLDAGKPGGWHVIDLRL